MLLRASFFIPREFEVFFSVSMSHWSANIVRKGTMWYLRETFLQPRTERCSSVSRRACSTVDVRFSPEIAVLSSSKLFKQPLNGITTFIKNISRA
jgi:hypothetical protein